MKKAKRIGSQKPTRSIYPKQHGGQVIKASMGLIKAMGLKLAEWQVLVLSHWLDRDEDGMVTSTTCVLEVPRQNGKSTVLNVFALICALVLERKVMYTAHQVKTVMKAFKWIDNMVQHKAFMRKECISVRRTNAQEGIYFANGGCIEFGTRTNAASRGLTYDIVIYDESQELTDEQMQAMSSVNSAAPSGDPQDVYAGTPPKITMSAETFTKVRSSIINGTDKACLDEWCLDDMPKDVTNKDLWYKLNPSLGIWLLESALTKDLMSMSKEGFAKEHLGLWLLGGARMAIPEKAWKACGKHKAPVDGAPIFGVKFSPDGYEVCLSAAVARKNDDGISDSAHVEFIKSGMVANGLSWLTKFLMDRAETMGRVVIDGKSAAPALVSELKRNNFPEEKMVLIRPFEAAQILPVFLEGINSRRLTHASQPQLDKSVTGARRRKIGQEGGWGLEPGQGVDCTQADSAALAYWGAIEIGPIEEEDNDMELVYA